MTRKICGHHTPPSAAGRIPSQVVLCGIPYYVRPLCRGTVQKIRRDSSTLTPATIISSIDGKVCANDIIETIARYLEIDDIYSRSFVSTIIIQTPQGVAVRKPVEINASGKIGRNTRSELRYAKSTSVETLLPSGPYFIYENGIYEAWRLYPDDLDSFEITVIPETTSYTGSDEKSNNPDAVTNRARFSVLNIFSPDGIWRSVAVPSRLYAKPSSMTPLAGARISVKDNFKLSGIKTTMTSRGFTELYPAESETAEYVVKLIELGAIIVAKSRMCSFAAGQDPTDQWIDFHCPFNPRGDTYQCPGSSSSGAATSLAGYPWLDYSIGTDTAGSIRGPAAANGLYGLRPSLGVSTMQGIFHLSRAFDTVGLLGRDLASLKDLASCTMNVVDSEKLPRKILYPTDFFPTGNEAQQAMLDCYVSVLEEYLGVRRTEFSFVQRWSESPPAAAKGKSLSDFLRKSTYQQYYYDAYHEYDSFRQDYRQAYGKEPYVGPIVQYRWEKGAKITAEQRNKAADKLAVYREWFDEYVMRQDPDSLSNAILVLPEGKAIPDYRDDSNPAPTTLKILGENTIAMVLQLPHLVLPIGQMPYDSRISGRIEHRPISASLLGAKGSDIMLIKLARAAFQNVGWPTKIQTGRYTFPLGMNVRNVLD